MVVIICLNNLIVNNNWRKIVRKTVQERGESIISINKFVWVENGGDTLFKQFNC